MVKRLKNKTPTQACSLGYSIIVNVLSFCRTAKPCKHHKEPRCASSGIKLQLEVLEVCKIRVLHTDAKKLLDAKLLISRC